MPLLTTSRYREQLLNSLRAAHSSVFVASAYITVPGIEAVLAQVSPQLNSLNVVARWDARDLVSGASDLEVYEKLRNRGFRFFVNPTLHAKFVLLDDNSLFLGSANCTGAGLQLGVKGNWEAGTCFIADESDKATVAELFAASVAMSDPIYAEIKGFIGSQEESAVLDCAFPPSIAEKLGNRGRGLWVRELPWTGDPRFLSTIDQNTSHDLRLFGIGRENIKDMTHISHQFNQSRCCMWLTSELKRHDGQLYFGQLTELLHDSLLEDPKPYRKDVKMLLNNLITWSGLLLPARISVDSPQHSQRVRFFERQDMTSFGSLGTFEVWIQRLASLRRDEIRGRWSSNTKAGAPHKPLLLLAVLDEVGREAPSHVGRVEITEDLQERFYLLWHGLMDPGRSIDIALPFYHLSSDGLWEIKAADGSDINPERARSLGYLKDVGAFADVNPEFGKLLCEQRFRRIAMDTILGTYFDAGSAERLKSVLLHT